MATIDPRFIRNYELRIQVPNIGTFLIRPPITIKFDFTKDQYNGVNKGTIEIYNLEPLKRDAIFKDKENGTPVILVDLRVGYGDTLETIIQGSVFQASTGKQDKDYVTKMEVWDGLKAFTESFVSTTVTRQSEVNTAILNSMEGITAGGFTTKQDTIFPIVLYGSSTDILKKEIGVDRELYWYIDSNKLFITKGNDVLSFQATDVNPETGLIGTPTRLNKVVNVKSLINPAIKIAGLVNIQSVISTNLNGIYRVEGIKYTGNYRGDEWFMELTTRVPRGTFVVLEK